MTKLWISLGAAVLLAANRPKPVAVAPALDPASGVVAIYVKPLAPEARGLSLRIQSIVALREDGSSAPLELSVRDLAGVAARDQRLLAWGAVPPGTYTGFAIKAASASLKDQEGDHALTLPASAPLSAFPFTIGTRRALLVVAEVDFRSSRGADDAFTPVFAFTIPSKLATGLVGAVTSRAMGAVVLFDKVSGHPVSLIAVGRGPGGLALDADRHRLYVPLAGDDAIATVDLVDASLLATSQLRAGDEPVSLALSQDGRTLLAANAGSSTVSVLDASAAALVERTRVQVGSGPRYVVMDPSGNKAWVFNALDDSISVLAVPGGGLVGAVASGGGPFRGDFGRAPSRLYVIHQSSAYLDVIDTTTLAPLQRVFLGAGASAIKVDPKTGRIYVGFKDSGRLDVFDPTGLLPIDHVEAGGSAGHLTIDGEGNNLCISIPSKGEVRLVRLVGKAIAARLDVPDPAESALPGER
jgi:DNA-binding beta-propeller fold protein YncE